MLPSSFYCNLSIQCPSIRVFLFFFLFFVPLQGDFLETYCIKVQFNYFFFITQSYKFCFTNFGNKLYSLLIYLPYKLEPPLPFYCLTWGKLCIRVVFWSQIEAEIRLRQMMTRMVTSASRPILGYAPSSPSNVCAYGLPFGKIIQGVTCNNVVVISVNLIIFHPTY